jgi:cyclophilin family peptidyl-prolyl cis-trans isomerase
VLSIACTNETPSATGKPETGQSTNQPVEKPAEKKSDRAVVIDTSMGKIVVELTPDQTPITVKNFLTYVDEKFYDGTIFHRVINGFMIQGGGFNKEMQEKPTQPPIKNEGSNGLTNDPYTIAMARRGDPDSATAQFYINVNNNVALNAVAPRPGYAVFGKVTSGQETVDKIKAVTTGNRGMYQDVPTTPVVIEKAECL